MVINDEDRVSQGPKIHQKSIVRSIYHDRHRPLDTCLAEYENLKQFFEGAQSTWEKQGSLGTHHKVDIAQDEIVNAKAKSGGHQWIQTLLAEQTDVESDEFDPSIKSITASSF